MVCENFSEQLQLSADQQSGIYVQTTTIKTWLDLKRFDDTNA